MFHVAVRGLAIRRPTLALMTDGASELLDRVLRVIGMICQRLLISGIARVFDG